MSNEKEVTIYDIAEKLKISPATVSRGLQDHPAISKKTKKKIFDLAEKIGYRSNHFARNLRNQKTNTIGVIVPRLNSSFMSSVIAGIEHIANAEGYNLIISQSSESSAREAANAKTLFNNRVDGLLVSLGYAGWGAGQLESELAQNAWLTVPCDERILFETPFEKRWQAAGRLLGIDVVTLNSEQARKHVPVLEGAQFEGAIWCATDGIVDIHSLLSGYLKAAASHGAVIRYNAEVRSVRRVAGGDIEISVGGEEVRAKTLINAAGAWANQLAVMAGAKQMPLRPCRRHLFVTPPIDWIDPKWPFVWDVAHDIYFRPEGEGLLLCACDQTELAPCDPPVDEAVKELLAEKIEEFMPALSGVHISRGWAGFRTLTPDGNFIIGWDPGVERLFWVAGLGGHGMTTSAAVGELAADLLMTGRSKQSPPFSPERFAA